MVVLVDFDNLEQQHQRLTVPHLVTAILQRLGPSAFTSSAEATVRLYGGWYEGQFPTRACQRLAADIHANFPTIVRVQDGAGVLPVRTTVELAYSMALEPNTHFFYTYRRRGMPHNLRCDHPHAFGCNDPHCPLISMHLFVTQGRCPAPGCQIKPQDLLYRGEQKLVDTMIAVDLLHYATQHFPHLSVLTSDDDLWPAIRAAMLQGCRITHIHTQPGHATPAAYCTGVGPTYVQTFL